MTTKTKKQVPQLTEEEQIRILLEGMFDSIVTQCGAFLSPFDMEKYRTIVVIDHESLQTNETLIRELLCVHFNLTVGRNRNGNHLIYFNYDCEAISKFGTRVYNQMLRLLIGLSAKELTGINIESRLRIATQPSGIQNFLWKRLIDKATTHIVITVVEKTSA